MKMWRYGAMLLLILFFPPMMAAQGGDGEHVVLQLKWKHLFQFAGFYMAKEKGYYDAAGLDVEIREKSPSVNIVRDVLSGEATYGVSDSALVLDRLQGKPVVALKAIFQHSPLALLSLASSGIGSVEALRGKRVMISPESAQNVSIMAMLKSHGVTESDIDIVPMSFDINDLIGGRVDAFTAYVTDQPVLLEERQIPYSLLRPSDYGFDFYGDILFTSETELQKHPGRVQAFAEASMQGWRYAFEHIDETVDVIKRGYAGAEITPHKLFKEAEALKAISGFGREEFGNLERSKILGIANTFAVLGKGVGAHKRLEGFVYDPGRMLLSEEERQFVAAHPLIRVSNEEDWPPYDYRLEGLATGYSVDLMRLLAEKIGVRIAFVTESWPQMLQMLKNHEIDAVHLMSITPERREYTLYSKLYMMSDRVIVTQEATADIRSMGDLNGKTVAAVRGWAITETMKRRYPKMEVLYRENAAALLDAVAYGEADAAVMDYMVANYLIKQKMLGNLKIAAKVQRDDDEELHIGVRSDWPQLKELFDRALEHVTAEERLALNRKWFEDGRKVGGKTPMQFSVAEQVYLRNKKRLRTCVDPNWMPLEAIAEGHYTGMGSDYLELFRERIGIPIEVVPTATWTESVRKAKARECDMFVFSMDTAERREYMNVTGPVIAPPLVIATRLDTWFLADLASITDQKIGIVSGYALTDVLRERYPQINFVPVVSMDEGLQKVIDGELYGFLDAYPVLGYKLQQEYLGELKIGGRFEDTWDLGVALRNDESELYTIFEKIVASISESERKAIENRWISVTFEEGFDYTMMWRMILLFSVVSGFLIFRNRQLTLHKRELDAKNLELEAQKQQMNFIAYHDTLTGLPNRGSFREKLEHAIGIAKRNERSIAILFVDLDRFKIVNDTLGHHIGDEMLKELAVRIRRTLRDTDTLSRIGGDEFTVLIETLRHPDEVAFVAEHILEVIQQPVHIGSYELGTTASIGIALYPEDGSDANSLIKNADSAMYLAKSEGKNSYRYYTKKLSDDVHRRMQIEHDLRSAIEKNELSLLFQPQYDLQTQQVVAAEALVRWRHGDGLIPPSEFIPIAEDSGIIVAIGEWVFTTACREFMAWKREGLPVKTIAINVSSVQFNQPNIVERFKAMVDEVGIDPQSVEIELTERYIMEHTQQNQTILDRLRRIGFRISVDDFGTGYSSMSYLKTLPLDTIKIDKSFIDEIPYDKNDVAITRAILALAKSLGYTVVAEGIEYGEQEQFLREHGCHYGQGYLFSRPLETQAFAAFLKEREKKA